MKTGKLIVLYILSLIISPAVINAQTLPTLSNTRFTSSGSCNLCHGASDLALRDLAGSDVSPVSRWRGTMLANSSKDPFWKAKVKHEGLENPDHRSVLENVCTRCHAPMGMIDALLNGSEAYTLDHLKNDDIGKDGISCTLCHQVNDFSLPGFSGNFGINTVKEIYGPYTSPITNQMFMNTGYTPVYSEKINNPRLCGSCHTLITNSVDEKGDPTGDTFIEQALYHEWKNSVYGRDNISCQSCHIPRIQESVRISSRPGFSPLRQPFGIHDMTGGNLFMLSLLKNNHDELALNSGVDFLGQTIERTRQMLTQETISMKTGSIVQTEDSVYVELILKNKAGHKFPTGFPSRRAYVQFLAINGADTIFYSGKPVSKALTEMDEDHFEPHHRKITREDQVQIYEFVMGDTKGDVTTVLEKAWAPLKDNRIVPEGFSNTHAVYDTVKVVGEAVNDPDYYSGKGEERITYVFPASGARNSFTIKASLHYETVPESWIHELFGEADHDEDIARFKTMYQNSDRTPLEVASATVETPVTSLFLPEKREFRIYPNPSVGNIRIEGPENHAEFMVFTSDGRYVGNGTIDINNTPINLMLTTGTYIFMIRSKGKTEVHQLIII